MRDQKIQDRKLQNCNRRTLWDEWSKKCFTIASDVSVIRKSAAWATASGETNREQECVQQNVSQSFTTRRMRATLEQKIL